MRRPVPEAALDAISLLRKDHTLLRRLSREPSDTTEAAVATRKKLLTRLELGLKAHTAIEDGLFYPALLEASDDIADVRKVTE